MGMTAVWGPPQSGKTTLAIDLAYALSQGGLSVCLISPELYGELSAKLSLKISRDTSLAAHKSKPLEQLVRSVGELFYVLAMPYDHDAFSEDISNPEAKQLLRQARELFDTVIVDCPSHTGSAIAAWALNTADRVLMMSGSHSTAVLWNNAYHRAVDAVENKTFHVCAQLQDTFDYSTLLTMLDVTPEVWLPHVPDAAMTQMQARTLYGQKGKQGKGYTQAIDQLCDLLNEEGGDAEA